MQKKRNSANLLFFLNLLKIISGHETLPVNFSKDSHRVKFFHVYY